MNVADVIEHRDRATILIVEDHDAVRKLLRAWLGDAFPQDTLMDVATGEEALASAASDPPDLVLMDIQLPEMNGIEATRRIKAIAPQTRVVILTSLNDIATRHAASEAGAIAFVAKLTMHRDLVPTLGALLHAPEE